MLVAAACAGVVAGALLQAATGFGFSLVAAPLMSAAIEPEPAVVLLLVLASTSTNGPPLLLHLLGRGATPAQVRDTLTVTFVGLAPIGVIALFATGDPELPDVALVLGLLLAVIAGHLAGRRLFARLSEGGRYEPVLTGILLVAAVVGLVGALL